MRDIGRSLRAKQAELCTPPYIMSHSTIIELGAALVVGKLTRIMAVYENATAGTATGACAPTYRRPGSCDVALSSPILTESNVFGHLDVYMIYYPCNRRNSLSKVEPVGSCRQATKRTS